MKNPFLRLSEKTAKRLALLFALLSVILIVLAVYINQNLSPYTITTYSMGSYVQQSVYGAGGEKAAQNAANAVAELENLISWRRIGSDAEALNSAAGKAVAVSSDTYELLSVCTSVSEKSGGAFDVTIAPLSRLWNFDERPNLPENSLIESLLPYVDYNNVLFFGENTVQLADDSTLIDLGAAGKGAACDKAIRVYEQNGVSHAVIAVGGSIGLYGRKPFGAPWNVSVKNPFESGSVGELKLKSGCISTSGSYEKNFEENGVIYHHILDPKTGYPAKNGLVSVTVVSDTGTLSDALSTACFVLGEEDGRRLLKEFSAEALFITEDKKITMTDGLKGLFILNSEDFTIYG